MAIASELGFSLSGTQQPPVTPVEVCWAGRCRVGREEGRTGRRMTASSQRPDCSIFKQGCLTYMNVNEHIDFLLDSSVLH